MAHSIPDVERAETPSQNEIPKGHRKGRIQSCEPGSSRALVGLQVETQSTMSPEMF